jgi:hypothetical protein
MQRNSTIITEINPSELIEIFNSVMVKHLKEFKNDLLNQKENENLLTREQVLKLLQINPTTLWNYQNKGKIKVYKFEGKSYFKRSEIMESLTLLKK